MIHLAIRSYEYECDDVIGAYSTPEQAERIAARGRLVSPGARWWVQSLAVNAVPEGFAVQDSAPTGNAENG